MALSLPAWTFVFSRDVVVDLPPSLVHSLLVPYLREFPLPNVRVVRSEEPSLIEVRFGSMRRGCIPEGARILIDPEDHTSRIHINVRLIPYIVGILARFLGWALGLCISVLAFGRLPNYVSPWVLIVLGLYIGIHVAWNFSRAKNMFGDSVAGYLKGRQLSYPSASPNFQRL